MKTFALHAAHWSTDGWNYEWNLNLMVIRKLPSKLKWLEFIMCA